VAREAAVIRRHVVGAGEAVVGACDDDEVLLEPDLAEALAIGGWLAWKGAAFLDDQGIERKQLVVVVRARLADLVYRVAFGEHLKSREAA